MLVYMPSPYWMRRSTKAAKLALRRAFNRPAERSVVTRSASALARMVIRCPLSLVILLSACLRHRGRTFAAWRQPPGDIALPPETTVHLRPAAASGVVSLSSRDG